MRSIIMAVHIGCSGWHYLHWRGVFYPAEIKTQDFLPYYLSCFNTVEINNSFYRLPSENTLLLWREGVTPDFTFAVKASRFITHNKKLHDAEGAFNLFFERVNLLGNKLGPVLFQLPPKWNFNAVRLESFLASLSPTGRYVMEFRHPDWLREQAFSILEKYNIGFCIHDMPGINIPERITAGFTYLRFHGSTGKYQGSYSPKMLESWVKKIEHWDKNNIDVYAYFNNDIGGFAPHDAQSLIKLLNKPA